MSKPAGIGEIFSAPERQRLLTARLFSDPPEIVATLRRELFGEVHARFVSALERALPGSKRDELALALDFVVGVLIHVIGGQLSVGSALGGNGHSDAQVFERMVRFASNGLKHSVGQVRGPR